MGRLWPWGLEGAHGGSLGFGQGGGGGGGGGTAGGGNRGGDCGVVCGEGFGDCRRRTLPEMQSAELNCPTMADGRFRAHHRLLLRPWAACWGGP